MGKKWKFTFGQNSLWEKITLVQPVWDVVIKAWKKAQVLKFYNRFSCTDT